MDFHHAGMNIQIVPVGESILPPSLYLLPGGSVARDLGQQSNFYLLDLAVLDGYFPRAAGFSDLNPIAVSLTRTARGLYYLTYDHDALLLARPIYKAESIPPCAVSMDAADDESFGDGQGDTCGEANPAYRPYLEMHSNRDNMLLVADGKVIAELSAGEFDILEGRAGAGYTLKGTLRVDKVVLA